MRKLVLLSFISILCTSCLTSQHKELSYHPFVLKAKETSLYTEKVDWAKVNAEFIELSKGKDDVEDLKPALQFLINSLEDQHAQIRSTHDHSIIVAYTGERKGNDLRDGEFVNKVINAPSEFSHKLLEDGIAYLKVVGIGHGDVKAQADQIRNGLLELKKQGANQWILDLRYNGGGNIEPMISGLAPLLGNGTIGYSVDHQNELRREYRIVEGQFDNWGRIACEMDALPFIDSSEKLVILLSRYTISSGEMVAVAFKGRENTIFIGEETAGYTTGNGYDQISDDLILLISQDVYADRNKKVYHDKVGVDEYIEFQHQTDLIYDNQLLRAIEWLKDL